MKKAIALFLLSIFLFNTVGYFIAFKVFQYQIQKEIKAEIKQQLNPSDLTTIFIDKNHLEQIEWVKEGKEMYYKGELYDVVRSTENSTSVTYHCINDKQEKSLFANLHEHINQYISGNKSLKNHTAKKLTNIAIKLYFSNETPFLFNAPTSTTRFFSQDLIYTSICIEINSPPPELA